MGSSAELASSLLTLVCPKAPPRRHAYLQAAQRILQGELSAHALEPAQKLMPELSAPPRRRIWKVNGRLVQQAFEF